MGPLKASLGSPGPGPSSAMCPFELRLCDLPQLGIGTARPRLREAEVTLRKARVM